MELPALLWILENEELHFSSPVDDFDDHYETSLPQAWYEFQEEQWRGIGEAFDHDPDEFWEERKVERDAMRKNSYVNCWHINENESAAMWDIYGESEYVVSVKTTVEGLMKSFDDQEEYAVAVGDIQYVDFDSSRAEISETDMDKIESVHSGNADSIGLNLLKREEFEHEKELRCVVLDGVVPDWLTQYTDHQPKQNIPSSVNVPVDLDELITEIRLAPNSPSWFIQSVIDAIENNRNTSLSRRDIRTSQLDTELYL